MLDCCVCLPKTYFKKRNSKNSVMLDMIPDLWRFDLFFFFFVTSDGVRVALSPVKAISWDFEFRASPRLALCSLAVCGDTGLSS